MVTTLLICFAFGAAFFGIRHELGGGLMFVVALILFGISLGHLAGEMAIGLSEVDHMH